jgi:hypothetical protein
VYRIVKDKICTNNIAETCTVDADCHRCETRRDQPAALSNNIAILCTTSADCAGTCEAGLPDTESWRSNDPATSTRPLAIARRSAPAVSSSARVWKT